ncbi:CCC motif membrane protein [Pedobacter mucosus]|uniref:CCC motif membrane protein n=1 Tax=Pedobacter mucosus TaxID=2895286 RepID=UPI001EE49FF7|nr:CCC motif membrane protein [Pedobacter mucosus]UKT64144.1 DUF4190 domain-containing protein [Pedobacter mucosus]
MSNEEGTTPEENQSNQPDSYKPAQPFANGPVTPPPFQPNAAFNQFGGMGQQNLPNSTASLVLGILAIPACCFYGIFGIIFGVIAWVLASGDLKKYNLNPGAYTLSSYKNSKAGKLCGIIAVSISVLFIIIIIIFGAAIVSNPQLIQEMLKNAK